MSKKDNIKILKKNYKNNPKSCSGDFFNKRIASTRNLTKIIVYLKEIKQYANYKDFKEDISIDTGHLTDALNWLLNHKIIIKRSNCQKYKGVYLINPEWEKLR